MAVLHGWFSRSRRHQAVVGLALCAVVGCYGRSPTPPNGSGSQTNAIAPPSSIDSKSPAVDTGSFAAVPGVGGMVTNPLLADELKQEDPTVAGWQSEAFHEQAGGQLNRLGELLVGGDVAEADLDSLATSNIAFGELRPKRLATAFADDTVVVRRPTTDAPSPAEEKGTAALAKALANLVHSMPGGQDRHVKFKGLSVNLDEQSARTTADIQLSASGPRGISQINALWQLQWTREEPPRLMSIRVTDYEEVQPAEDGRLLFADIAPAVLGSNPSYREQLAFGYDYWRARSDRSLGSDLAGNQGIALGDVNGDGLDDVYIMQPGGLPNRLYLHQADGTTKDVSREAGVDYLDFSRAAPFLDLDNDGDQDLVLGMNPGLLLLENDGEGHFTQRAALPCPGSVYSLAAADYDNDGRIDVYACGRYPQGALGEETRVQGLPVPYHDANNGGPSSLWRNDGGWKFRNVTEAVGLDVNNRRFTLAAAWEDYDDDGDQDLYVANDFGRNNLYRNDGGTFTDVAAAEGVEDIGAGMSASWGDADGDGRMDLYVGNMFSSAGHRVAFQDKFMPDVDSRTRAEFQRHARGNSLFLNRGERDGADFDDVTLPAQVNMGRWAWGSMFVDLNCDGREDLFVANGFITTDDTGDL